MQDWLRALRCFADVDAFCPGELELSREEGRHLMRVRRAGAGSEVSILNGRGEVARAKVCNVNRGEVSVDIFEILRLPSPQPHLTLLAAALKQSAWDELLRHVVELGVNRVIRVQSEHAVSELETEKLCKKAGRWRDCMTEACKQSGNPWRPELTFAESVEEACGMVAEIPCQFLAGMTDSAVPLSDYLREKPASGVGLWVGPEGDFSASEMHRIQSAGAKPVSLGPRILRAETAALSLLACLRLQHR